MKDGTDRWQREEEETHEKKSESIILIIANEKHHTLCDHSPIDDLSL